MPGRLVAATEEDVDLVTEWFAAFIGDADEQASLARGASAHEVPGRPEMLRRLRDARIWFWVDDAGSPVHVIYAALGYRPVVDMANLVILR